MIVRKMRPEEFDSTVNLFGYYRDEAIESLPKIADEYDETSVLETIRKFATNYEYSWFNAYDNQRPVGFVAGYLSACPWNKNIIIANIAFIYLLTSHRGMDNFRELMKSFEDWARMAGATELTAGDIGIDPERTQRLFEYFDFKPGVWMGKELTNG